MSEPELHYSKRIGNAIAYAINVHWIEDQQRRKGKDVPYIVHPLTVALILSRVTDDEDLIVAGLLHDTVEDSERPPQESKEVIRKQFGDRVLELVDSVTEQDKRLRWDKRKQQALDAIEHHSGESLMLKSADLIANIREIYGDFQVDGATVFERFNQGRGPTLAYYDTAVSAIIKRWPENPLTPDLRNARMEIAHMR